eukprot:276507_1
MKQEILVIEYVGIYAKIKLSFLFQIEWIIVGITIPIILSTFAPESSFLTFTIYVSFTTSLSIHLYVIIAQKCVDCTEDITVINDGLEYILFVLKLYAIS